VLKGTSAGCWHDELAGLRGLNSLDCRSVVAKLVATAL
jgi:hypothetical protein